MRVVSLFSGAGGLDLGLKKAGHEIILQCEQDPGAQQVLRQNFPGTLLLPDVCSLETLPKGCELLVAGFPCIDISRAGLRKGFEGQSSGLVRHVFRLLQDAKDRNRPVPWVLLENVEALLDRGVNGVPYVKSIADTFEAIGYSSWAHRVICSAGFGIPNRRSRVFFLASLYGDARDVLLAQGPQCCLGSCLDDYQENGVSGLCYECFQEDMSMKENAEHSFALDLGNARSAPGVDVVPTFTTHNDRICLLLGSKQMGMLRIQDAERLQGFPEGFTEPCFPIQQPGLNSHKNRQIKETEIDAWESKRYALLGNAVTVKVAEWLGERLSLPYKFKYVPCDRDKALALEFQNQHKFRKPGYIDLDMVDDSMEGLLVKSSKPHTNSNSTSLQMDEDSVETAERNGTTNSKTSQKVYWPRAAWFVAGIGRFGVEDLSECPKKVPFQPLGKFITQVGKLPGPDAINTYIMRLREQGWNVENIVNKATKCGMKFHKEVSEVVRMEGFVNDCDQIGDLVWCVCRITKVWWPGYMLDPFDLPTGLDIPQSAIDNLTLVERKAWLPIEYWEDDQEAVFGPKTENQTKKEQDLMKNQRKILVIFFGDNCHDWAYPHDVLDFNKYQNEKEGEAQSLEQSGNLKRPKLFWKALNEAHLWQEVKKKNNKGSGCISAVASRAASLAAAENRKPRCGNCEACLNRLNGGSTFSRRCLYVRAQAAAAAGHVGAQVAIHREKAIGAKVELYWPLDQKWFPGTVTGFDMLRLRHTVLYEDGDREIIALWSPCQLVRVLNKPKDWPESAKEIEQQQQQQQQEKQKSTKIVQQELDQTVKTEMTDYEANRQEKIQKNKELLSSVFEQITDDGVTQVKEASLSKLIQLSTNTKEQSTERRNSDIEQVTLDEEEAEQEEEEEEVEQENEKMLCDIDIFAMLELGGPCRHTRSARRELTEFLSDDKNDRAHTPAAKRTKIIDSREIHDP